MKIKLLDKEEKIFEIESPTTNKIKLSLKNVLDERQIAEDKLKSLQERKEHLKSLETEMKKLLK